MIRRAVVLLALAGCGHREKPRSTTTLVVHVADAGAPVGARVLLRDRDAALHVGTIDLYGARQAQGACAIAPAVAGESPDSTLSLA